VNDHGDPTAATTFNRSNACLRGRASRGTSWTSRGSWPAAWPWRSRCCHAPPLDG